MTDALLRRSQFALAPLQRRELGEALELCSRDEPAYVGPLAHIEHALLQGEAPHGLWGLRRRGRAAKSLVGLVWSGATLTVVLDASEDPEELLAHTAAALVSRVPRPASIVGPAGVTLDLWGRIEPWWGPSREVRPRQPLLVIDCEPSPGGQASSIASSMEPMRPAKMQDYEQLLAAAVHMFTAEVGYDPLQYGRAAYEDRLQYLVSKGRSYVIFGAVDGVRDIVFKAEVGVVGGSVAQIQGVWVHPTLRGQGLGKWGMECLVRQVRADIAPVISLYVNDFNAPALAVYEAVGFRQVGTFATVMF